MKYSNVSFLPSFLPPPPLRIVYSRAAFFVCFFVTFFSPRMVAATLQYTVLYIKYIRMLSIGIIGVVY